MYFVAQGTPGEGIGVLLELLRNNVGEYFSRNVEKRKETKVDGYFVKDRR